MNLPSGHVADGSVASSEPLGNAGCRLQGWKLSAVRTVYLAAILSAVVVFAVAVPARQAQLAETVRNLSPAQQLVLQELGISVAQHAGLVLTLETAVPLVFLSIGLLIAWRKSDDWLALQVSAGMIAYSLWISPPLNALLAANSPWSVAALLIQVYAMTSVALFLYIFPDGRFVPGWTRLLLLLWVLWAAAWVLLPGSVFDLSNIFEVSLLSFASLMAWLATGVVAQLYRFFRVATPVQRQQTKLVLFGSTVAILGYLVFGFDRFAISLLNGPRHAAVVYDLIGVPIFLVTIVAIPVSFAISIFRYRLWDIDLVISRVIMYAALSAVLGGMYSSSIALSQRLFVALTGEKSDAAIVITTLVVASTFTHVRGRLQSVADRYVKPRPDPIRSMESFGDQMRAFYDLIDVEQMTRRALHEAVQAFGATSGAIYLERNGRFEPAHVEGEWTQVEGLTAWLESGGSRYGWIALGPRANGADYTSEDEAVLQEIASQASRAIMLIGRVGLGAARQRPGALRNVVGDEPS